jgi:IS30 family transposase
MLIFFSNGKEFAHHESMTEVLDAAVYFVDPTDRGNVD